MAGGADGRSRAFRWLRGFAHVVQGFVSIGARVENAAIVLRRADPSEPRPIEFDFFSPGKLSEIERRKDRSQSGAIGFGNAIDIIGGDHRPAAGHVAHDQIRISRDISPHITGIGARPQVVRIAGIIADHDADGFSFVERFALSVNNATESE